MQYNVEINGKKVLITTLTNEDSNVLKDIVDVILNKMGSGLIVLANIKEDRINLIVRNNLEDKSAGDIIKFVASKLDGNGGGSKTFAQGAAKNISELEKVLKELKENM